MFSLTPVVRQEKYLAFKEIHIGSRNLEDNAQRGPGNRGEGFGNVGESLRLVDGLRSHPSTEIVYLYDVSQSVEAMIMDTFAQDGPNGGNEGGNRQLVVTLKNNSR